MSTAADDDTLRDMVRHRVFESRVDPVQLALEQARRAGYDAARAELGFETLDTAIRLATDHANNRHKDIVRWLRLLAISAVVGCLFGAMLVCQFGWFVSRAREHDAQAHHAK